MVMIGCLHEFAATGIAQVRTCGDSALFRCDWPSLFRKTGLIEANKAAVALYSEVFVAIF
jgi:hypothetical protein